MSAVFVIFWLTGEVLLVCMRNVEAAKVAAAREQERARQ